MARDRSEDIDQAQQIAHLLEMEFYFHSAIQFGIPGAGKTVTRYPTYGGKPSTHAKLKEVWSATSKVHHYRRSLRTARVMTFSTISSAVAPKISIHRRFAY